jgi:xanthine dehydrogenase YagS FAD-binding subunit
VRPFAYEVPSDALDAVRRVAAQPDAAFLGGGTNLVDHLKLGIAAPATLVDVTALRLDEIADDAAGGLRIGVGVRNSDLAADPRVRRRYPLLAEALLNGASGQLRNMATTGGNLLQRTRCAYFQNVTTPCNKRTPGSGCSAIGGWTRQHAILGASEHCVATHPSDMAVAMVALDAVVEILGPGGERSLPLIELYRLDADAPDRDTVLEHGELISGVVLPPLAAATCSRYRKVRDRASYAFALVSVAAALELRDGVVRDVRIALGGVAHKPWRARRAEEALRGAPATLGSYLRAADAELAEARGLEGLDGGNAFKVELVRRTLASTLRDLADRGATAT